MHDVNGKPLKAGDKVIIHGTITVCHPSEDYCNCTIETEHGRRPDGQKENICAINTGVLELVEAPEIHLMGPECSEDLSYGQ